MNFDWLFNQTREWAELEIEFWCVSCLWHTTPHTRAGLTLKLRRSWDRAGTPAGPLPETAARSKVIDAITQMFPPAIREWSWTRIGGAVFHGVRLNSIRNDNYSGLTKNGSTLIHVLCNGTNFVFWTWIMPGLLVGAVLITRQHSLFIDVVCATRNTADPDNIGSRRSSTDSLIILIICHCDGYKLENEFLRRNKLLKGEWCQYVRFCAFVLE